MAITTVLFDKDGTLLDFDAFWVTVTEKAVTALLEECGAPLGLMHEIYEAIGIKDGITDVRGVLCWGTYGLMGEAIYRVLAAHGVTCTMEDIVARTAETYHRFADSGRIAPVCPELDSALAALKGEGRRLIVVTNDGPVMTEHCLAMLGIRAYFDQVITDDGITVRKPDPASIHDILTRYALTPDQVVMVGDTRTDLEFGKNGGIRTVGVAKTQEGRDYLALLADAVLPDVSSLGELLRAWDKEN